MRLCLYIMFVILPAVVTAQKVEIDKTGKRQPESRPLDVQQRPDEAALPAIDLPEFVITGSVTINPPDAQKYPYDEQGLYVRHASENTPGTRDRETIDLGERFKQSLLTPSKYLGGMLRASLGNFFTPEIAASVGLSDASYDLTASAAYRRTKGFTRNADASSAAIAVQGSHEIETGSSTVQNVRLKGALEYDTRAYKFYGSLVPSTQRDISRFALHIQTSGDIGSETSLQGGLTVRNISVVDSTTTTTENGFRADLSGTLPVVGFPLDVRGRAWFSTVTAITARKLSLITLSVGTPRLSWGNFSMSAGAEGHAVEGMDGQKGAYFYPYVLLDLRVTSRHTAFLSFRPSPEFAALEDHLDRNPYLSGGASMRHPIARLAVSGGLESDWSAWLSTRLWIEYKSMTEYPFYVDSTNSGMWLLAYGGKTSITSFHIDAVANITSNDYFAFKSTSRVTSNTVTQHIPYAPEFEASASWTHRFMDVLDISPGVGMVSRQDADLAGTSRVEGHLWTGMKVEYLGLGDLRFFLNVTNFMNQNYETWKGYRAEPFRMSAGLTYRW